MKNFLVFGLFGLVAHSCFAEEILPSKLIRIVDGDTIVVLLKNHQQMKVRFADIDAPEHDQPFGQVAKRYLSSLIWNKPIALECRGKGAYKRSVCTVYSNGVDVNRKMVEAGYAWVFEKYNQDPSLIPLMNSAKNRHIGLWQKSGYVSPGLWRQCKKKHWDFCR